MCQGRMCTIRKGLHPTCDTRPTSTGWRNGTGLLRDSTSAKLVPVEHLSSSSAQLPVSCELAKGVPAGNSWSSSYGVTQRLWVANLARRYTRLPGCMCMAGAADWGWRWHGRVAGQKANVQHGDGYGSAGVFEAAACCQLQTKPSQLES